MTDSEAFRDICSVLAAPGAFHLKYGGEDSFEDDVWKALRRWARRSVPDEPPKEIVLTSHTKRHGRCAHCWRQFLLQKNRGPDVKALGSKNRLDIVVQHRRGRTIGVEAKCLGKRGHAQRLVHGLGQAALALAHRDRTIVVIHCGTVDKQVRANLREVAAKAFKGSRLAVIVVPSVRQSQLRSA